MSKETEKYSQMLTLAREHAEVSPYFKLFFTYEKIKKPFPNPDELKPTSVDAPLSRLLTILIKFIYLITDFLEEEISKWQKVVKEADISAWMDDNNKQKLLELETEEKKGNLNLTVVYCADLIFFKTLLNPIMDLLDAKAQIAYFNKEKFILSIIKDDSDKPSSIHLAHALPFLSRILGQKSIDCFAKLIREDVNFLKLEATLDLTTVAKFFYSEAHGNSMPFACTPLHVAAAVNNIRIIELILSFSPLAVNYISTKKKSAIWMALFYGQADSAALLTRSGAHFDPYAFLIGLPNIDSVEKMGNRHHIIYQSLQTLLEQPLLKGSKDKYYHIYNLISELCRQYILNMSEGTSGCSNYHLITNLLAGFLGRHISFEMPSEPGTGTYTLNSLQPFLAILTLGVAWQKLYNRLIHAISSAPINQNLLPIVTDYLLDTQLVNAYLPPGISFRRERGRFGFFPPESPQPSASSGTHVRETKYHRLPSKKGLSG